jgi:acyl-CoA thioesterase-1
MPPNYGPLYTQRFANTFSEVAKAHRVALVPFLMEGFADRPDLFQADGIHPTSNAQALIVDTVWQGLKPLLAAQPARR